MRNALDEHHSLYENSRADGDVESIFLILLPGELGPIQRRLRIGRVQGEDVRDCFPEMNRVLERNVVASALHRAQRSGFRFFFSDFEL